MTDDAFHLTALDARRYDFGNALRGYDRARVDLFREQVAEELERLSRANQELDAKARNFHEQLRAFRERDKALNEALISAQQLRGEIREQAQREAQLIIREAQGEAERALEGIRTEMRRAEDELQQLWRARRSFLAQLRHVVERQLTELEGAEAAPPPAGLMSTGSDASRESRSPVRDSSPEAPRVVLREPVREERRQVPREDRRELPLEAPREAPREPGRDATPESLRELVREMPREPLPPRASAPTPSWLDVVEDE